MPLTAAEVQVLLTAKNTASATVKQFRGDLDNLGKSTGATTKQIGGLEGAMKMATGALALYAGVQGLVSFLGASTKAAASLEKELSNVAFSAAAANREFGNSVGTTESWAATVARVSDEFRTFSEQDVASATTRLIDMTKRLGLSEEQMQTLLTRTADLSAGKVDLAGGIERVSAAMRGEAESAEYLGLSLNENSVKAYAESLGLVWSQLSDVEKAQQRYLLFLEQTAEMEGRAATAAETHAGKVDALNNNYTDFQAGLGGMLIAMDEGIGITEYLSQGLENDAESAKQAADGWKKFFEAIRVWRDDVPAFRQELTETSIAAAMASPHIEDLVAAIEEAPGSFEDVQRALVAQTGSMEEYDALIQRLNDAALGPLGAQLALTEEQFATLSEEVWHSNLAVSEFAIAINAAATDIADYETAAVAAVKVNRITSLETANLKERYRAMGIEMRDAEDVIDDNRLAEEELKRAIEDHERAVKDLLNTQADYILGLQDADESATQSASEYANSRQGIIEGANEQRLTAEEQLSKDLEKLAEDRAAALHRVETGGMAKGAAQTEADYQWTIADFDSKEKAIREAYDAEIATITEKEGERKAVIDAARQVEIERERAHFEEMKLQAGLGVLESAGLLEQFTGIAGASSSQVAEMIRAGIIPLSGELAVAVGAGLASLDQQATDAVATQEANATAISQMADGEYAALDERLSGIRSESVNASSALEQGLAGVGLAATNVSTGGLADMETQLATMSSSISPAMQQMADEVAKVDDNVGEILGSFETLVGEIAEAFDDKDWEEIGEAVVAGIAEGIVNGEDNATTAMAGVVRAMLNAAKREAGIESPSTLFRDEIGVQIGAGIIEGIHGMTPDMDAEMWDYIKIAFNSAYSAVDAVLPAWGGNLEKGVKNAMEYAFEMVKGSITTDMPMDEIYDMIMDKAITMSTRYGVDPRVISMMRDTLEPIIRAQVAGIADVTFGDVFNTAGMYLSAANVLSGAGSAAGTRYKQTVIDPAQEQLNTLNEQLATMRQQGTTLEAEAEVKARIADLEAEITSNQERQDELSRQQSDLAYLQSQANLLKLISDYGLNASDILGGLALGVDADAGQLMEAMTSALQAMVSAAETELGIASPSKRFQEIGQQMMAGMALGIDKASIFPTMAAQSAAGNVTQNTYYLTANYPYQRPGSLAADVRRLQMLSAKM